MNTSVISLPGAQQQDFLDSLAQEFKYNFAQLSEGAERELAGRPFIFSRYGKELYPYFEEADAALVPGCIIPIKEGRPVASVDSTCITLGETAKGALYAARTAVGMSYEGSLRRFFRLGPILVYASESGLVGLGERVCGPELSLALSDHSVAERVVRNSLERRVLEALLAGRGESIAMADGSLKHPMGQRTGRLGAGLEEGKCLVGFSKSSSLIFSAGALGTLTKAEAPSFCRVAEGPVPTVLAKFAKDGLVFRLDVASKRDDVATVLGRIAWNDAFSSGYPDSLKLAHHLSVFSGAEVQGLKALVAKRFRLKQVPTFQLRSVALGSFKGGS